MHGVLDQQRVQPLGRLASVAIGARDEERAELVPQAAQGVKVVPRDALAQVLTIGDEFAQAVKTGKTVTRLAAATTRVREPYRELSVGVEVHARP